MKLRHRYIDGVALRACIRLVFGKDYVSISYLPLVIIVVGQLVNVFFGTVGHLLSVSGNEKIHIVRAGCRCFE